MAPKPAIPNEATKPANATTGAVPKPKFIFVHGDKGGVGKSMVAMALANYLVQRAVPVALIEADTRNPDVGRMFEEAVPTLTANVRVENGWMDVMDFVMKHSGRTIIMNTPAGIGEHMQAELRSFKQFLNDQEMPIELELWWVMSINHDSVNLLQEAVRAYGDSFTRTRVVCNSHFGQGGDKSTGPFMLWHEHGLKVQIEQRGGQTIVFPALHIRVVQKIMDPRNIMPFSDAVDAVMGEKVGLVHSERWKMQGWLKDCGDVFDPIFTAQPLAQAA